MSPGLPRALLLSGALAASVAPTPARAMEGTETLRVGGRERTYIAHPPPHGAATPFPLVLVLHGRTGSGAGTIRLTHMNTLADRYGFLAVFPDGVSRSWADGRGTPADDEGVDDVAFLSALIDHLEAVRPVDPKRVYVCGISNGGFMAARLGCARADRVAAIGVVAATFGADAAAACRPARPLPAMIIHGSADPLVPAVGGRSRGAKGPILSIDESIRTWVRLDGCADAPTISAVPNRSSGGTRTRREAYAGCREGAEVVLMRVEDGGHTWPGGSQYLPAALIGPTSPDFDAGETLWDFFSRHPRP